MHPIIDIHCHIFPEKIAGKAAANIGLFYGIEMAADGTLHRMLTLGKKAGISHYVICSAATVPDQVRSINDFIAASVAQSPDELTGFGSLHPDMENPAEEIEHIINLGLKGVKLHPDFQRFNIDSLPAKRLYALLEGRLPVLVHTGDYRYDFSHPRRMARVADEFPGLTVIGAHFGGWSQVQEALEHLAPRNVFVDTSSSLYALTPEQGQDLVRRWGADRVLYGTDYPMWDFAEELGRVRALHLTSEECEKIFYQNAKKLIFDCSDSLTI